MIILIMVRMESGVMGVIEWAWLVMDGVEGREEAESTVSKNSRSCNDMTALHSPDLLQSRS